MVCKARKFKYFKRGFGYCKHHIPSHSDIIKVVRAYDFAGTLPYDGNRETDYFASVKMAKLRS